VLKNHEQLVSFNTVNMANAVSPMQPKEQLEQLVSDIGGGSAVGMWMGDEDELFDVKKIVTSYFPDCITVANAKHLGILLEADKFMGPWIMEEVAKRTSAKKTS